VFASLGDAINSLTINTSTLDGSNVNSVFNQPMLVITTGDQNADAHIRDAFQQAGFPAEAMNTDIIGKPDDLGLQPLGFGPAHTIWSFLYRIALCQNASDCDAYQKELGQWGVLRVAPKVVRATKPFGVPPLRPRDESYSEADLKNQLNQLVQNVQVAYSSESVLQSAEPLLPLTLEGRECIRTLTNCVGATRDAAYIDGNEPLLMVSAENRFIQEFLESDLLKRLSEAQNVRLGRQPHEPIDPPRAVRPNIEPNGPSYLLKDDPKDFLVVVGVIHSVLGNSTYSNLAVYNVAKSMAVGGVIDTQQNGSALPFLQHQILNTAEEAFPSINVNASIFYVQKFSRNCSTNEQYCFTVPTTFPGVPLDGMLTFAERAYLEPSTKVGPDPNNLLPPIILQFNSSSPENF